MFTSIIPCLALRGVGRAIATSPTLVHKVLLLNGTPDRETPENFTATDFISALRRSLNFSSGGNLAPVDGHTDTAIWQASDYVTHLLYLKDGSIPLDRAKLEVRAGHLQIRQVLMYINSCWESTV